MKTLTYIMTYNDINIQVYYIKNSKSLNNSLYQSFIRIKELLEPIHWIKIYTKNDYICLQAYIVVSHTHELFFFICSWQWIETIIELIP